MLVTIGFCSRMYKIVKYFYLDQHAIVNKITKAFGFWNGVRKLGYLEKVSFIVFEL